MKLLLLSASAPRQGAAYALVRHFHRWRLDYSEGQFAAKGTGEALKLPALALAIINAKPRIEGNPYMFASDRTRRADSWSWQIAK